MEALNSTEDGLTNVWQLDAPSLAALISSWLKCNEDLVFDSIVGQAKLLYADLMIAEQLVLSQNYSLYYFCGFSPN